MSTITSRVEQLEADLRESKDAQYRIQRKLDQARNELHRLEQRHRQLRSSVADALQELGEITEGDGVIGDRWHDDDSYEATAEHMPIGLTCGSQACLAAAVNALLSVSRIIERG